MPDFTRDPDRLLRAPADAGVVAPGAAPIGPLSNMANTTTLGIPNEMPQGQCIADMTVNAVGKVAEQIDQIVDAATRGAFFSAAAQGVKAATYETLANVVLGAHDALSGEACITAKELNADNALDLGLGAIQAP